MLSTDKPFKCGHPRTPENTYTVPVTYKRERHPICLTCYRHRRKMYARTMYKTDSEYRDRKLRARADDRARRHYVAGITEALVTGA